MSNYEIISKRVVSNLEVQTLIKEKAKKEESELTYREEKIKDFLKKAVKLKKTDYEKAKKEIVELEIPRLEVEQIIKILDNLPKNGTELRAIVSNTGTVLVDENLEKILKVLKKYK